MSLISIEKPELTEDQERSIQEYEATKGVELFSGDLQEYEGLKGKPFQIIDTGERNKYIEGTRGILGGPLRTALVTRDGWAYRIQLGALKITMMIPRFIYPGDSTILEAQRLGAEALIRYNWGWMGSRGIPVRSADSDSL